MIAPGGHRQECIGMYFPARFNHKLAMRLGGLIETAYDQFHSLVGDSSWRLPRGYELVKEIKYSIVASSIVDRESAIGKFILKLPLLKERQISESPIGFVARRKTKAYIIFRGTQTSTEWINNLNAKLMPLFLNDHGNVHDGFLTLYLNVREQILDAAEALPGKRPIFIAGHSLGAALAALAACDLESTLALKIASLYTFGSPRIGDNNFVAAFNRSFARKSFRIANSSDMVTEVPFPTRFAGFFGAYFSHTETPVIFTTQKEDNEKNHEMQTYLAALSESRRNPLRWLMEKLGRTDRSVCCQSETGEKTNEEA